MSSLILVRHSSPKFENNLRPGEWQLSPEGRRLCRPLAYRLAGFKPQRVFSSEELKAMQTAELLAEQLKLPWQIYPNLHEHVRPAGLFSSQKEFKAQVKALFASPEKLVMGEETALQAKGRFQHALESLISENTGWNLAVVSHGTVISLLVAFANSIDPYEFWVRLGLPSAVVVTIPDFKLLEVVESVDAGSRPI